MTTSRMIATLFSAMIALSACAGDQTTEPAEAPQMKRHDKADKAARRTDLLADVPVSGLLANAGVPAGSFAGTITAKRFDIDPATRALSMTGVLRGTATLLDGRRIAVVDQQFTTPVMLSGSRSRGVAGIMNPVSSVACAAAEQAATVSLVAVRRVQASCDVLFLDLGPLHLDLLGLTVDLSQVILDVNAVTGAGNLLGNLLCALLGLLDGIALLSIITQLLERINDILGGLNPAAATGASFDAPTATAPTFRST